MLSKMVASLSSSTPEETDRATSGLVELLRSTAGTAELAQSFFERVVGTPELRQQPHQRRALARYVDAFVDCLGVECCPIGVLSILVESLCQQPALREEATSVQLVASEVLLGILSGGLPRAWELLWTAYADGQAPVLQALLVQALERSPMQSFAQLVGQLKNPESRFPALELICAAGRSDSSLLSGALDESLEVFAALMPIIAEDRDARNVGTALLAAVIMSRAMPSRAVIASFAAFAQGVARALCWQDGSESATSSLLMAAAAFAFFHLYSVCPSQTLLWARAQCDGTTHPQAASFARGIRQLLSSHSVALHPGLILWSDEQLRNPPSGLLSFFSFSDSTLFTLLRSHPATKVLSAWAEVWSAASLHEAPMTWVGEGGSAQESSELPEQRKPQLEMLAQQMSAQTRDSATQLEVKSEFKVRVPSQIQFAD
jgi:hypothetical protein